MPFPWNEEEHGGFTSGTPWLKCNDDYASICAEKQSQDKNSLLYYYRNLIQVRKDEANRECLIYGEVREIENAVESVIAFERIAENGEKIQIWINMSDEIQKADIIEGELLCNGRQREEVVVLCLRFILLKRLTPAAHYIEFSAVFQHVLQRIRSCSYATRPEGNEKWAVFIAA
mgnify:CR=1 FL=1